MKAKVNYSGLDDRKYIGVVLTIFGIFASGTSMAIAWPALKHITIRIIS